MQQDLILKVFEEIKRDLNRVPCEEVVVTPEQLARKAKWMRDRRGYEHTMESLMALEAYMKGYSLWLEGPVGVGKTHFFESVGDEIVFFSPMRHMATRLEDIEDEVREARYNDMVIDDIGSEPVYNNFGSKIDILPWLIEERMCSPCRTHFTTNLRANVISNRYGTRVIDRIGGMSRKFELVGESRRKATANWRYVKKAKEDLLRGSK